KPTPYGVRLAKRNSLWFRERFAAGAAGQGCDDAGAYARTQAVDGPVGTEDIGDTRVEAVNLILSRAAAVGVIDNFALSILDEGSAVKLISANSDGIVVIGCCCVEHPPNRIWRVR